MWFQHDGAPHGINIVWIDQNVDGIYGTVLGPWKSPDLNPLDFYLWGHLKQLVYGIPINIREKLIIKNALFHKHFFRESKLVFLTQGGFWEFSLNKMCGLLSNFIYHS